MRKAKKLSITLMASVMALGAVAFTAQPANASYGYKYTDSQRPPVSTPTGYVNPAMGSTVTVTDPAPTTNKLTTPKASTTIENITVTNVAPKYSDYNDIAAYSLAVADYFMAKIMAIYGNGNTALNRYGFGR